MKFANLVRKTHIYDGTSAAGKPVDPPLVVTKKYPHVCAFGPTGSTVCELSDGTWAFQHNLEVVKL